MLRYLKEAFWLGADLPGLGRLPLNALGVLGFGILGLGNPGFWLLGLGLEAGYLALLATNPRFQKVIDARRRVVTEEQEGVRRTDLLARMPLRTRERLAALEAKNARILEIGRDRQADDFHLESNRQALDQLAWTYLKLLVARDNLLAARAQADGQEIGQRIEELEREVAQAGPSALLESRRATLALLERRRANLANCEETLREIDSDLERVEAQVDLALENAGMRGGGELISARLELASQLLTGGLDYGEAGESVVALDAAYRAREKEPGPG